MPEQEIVRSKISQGSLVSVSILIGACGYTAWLFTSLAALKQDVRDLGAELRIQSADVRAQLAAQGVKIDDRWTANDHRRWELELGRLNPTLTLPGDKH